MTDKWIKEITNEGRKRRKKGIYSSSHNAGSVIVNQSHSSRTISLTTRYTCTAFSMPKLDTIVMGVILPALQRRTEHRYSIQTGTSPIISRALCNYRDIYRVFKIICLLAASHLSDVNYFLLIYWNEEIRSNSLHSTNLRDVHRMFHVNCMYKKWPKSHMKATRSVCNEIAASPSCTSYRLKAK